MLNLTLSKSQMQNAMYILSRLEENNNVYNMNIDEIMSLMKKYELLNDEFLSVMGNANA